jgi:radical SAM protein with 4Fe4S-binding SPASM domain
MTSNGHSVRILADEDLRAFHELEFSLDYPDEAEQDAQRGAGNWALIHEQAARCRALGLPVTFIAVMMRSNFDRLADIAAIAGRYDAPLRLNVYQAVRSDRYSLSYEEYWSGFQLLFDRTDVLAIGEPLVRAMAGLPPRQGGCGVATIRVTPRATVQPCVYWPGHGAPLDVLLELGEEILTEDAFVGARSVPKACSGCDYLASCRGGCAGRRRLLDRLDQPDPYCPIIRNERRPLQVALAQGRVLAKSDSACTTVVMARSNPF